VTFASLLAVACQGTSPACRALPDCGRGFECLAHVCVPTGGAPVTLSSERRVIYPDQMRLSGPASRPSGLPHAFTLGASADDALLLSFYIDSLGAADVERAFVTLYPTRGGVGNPLPLKLRLKWQTGSRQTLFGEASSHALTRGDNPVRFDVTSALKAQLRPHGDSYQVTITADSDTGTQSFELLGYPATSPRLEIYALTQSRDRRAAPP
jgi:hypothetical protein